jgi:hypothetical protein
LIWTRLFSHLLYTNRLLQKKKQRPEERADNETRPMEKRTHLGDGLVLELTGSLGELRELGSL